MPRYEFNVHFVVEADGEIAAEKRLDRLLSTQPMGLDELIYEITYGPDEIEEDGTDEDDENDENDE